MRQSAVSQVLEYIEIITQGETINELGETDSMCSEVGIEIFFLLGF
jgi:hypothetical protein